MPLFHCFFFFQYAPWCSWCIKLAPTWEAFAEEVEKEIGQSLQVAKVIIDEQLTHAVMFMLKCP